MAICLTSVSSNANSSHKIQFNQLPGDENLASNYVNHITQRHDGFIWIATAEGVSRFDGKNYINHQSYPDNPNSLPNPWVNYLLEDHNNQLWVATAVGLARMLADEINFEQYKFIPNTENTIAGNNIVHIFEDDQDRLWFSTSRGLSRYLPETNDFENHYIYDESDNNELISINVVAQKDEHNLWIGTNKGLFTFDIETAEFKLFSLQSSGFNSYEILDLSKDQKGSLWVVTAYYGLLKLEADSLNITAYYNQPDNPNSIISDGLWNVMIDNNDDVWVASWGEGISQISTSDGHINRYKHNRGDHRSIPSNLTTDVFQDKTGLIWVATYDGIALYDPNSAIENIRPIPGKKNSLSSDLVWVFEETADAIWVGTTEGLNRWDKSTQQIENYYSVDDEDPSKEFTSIWNMTLIDENTLWLGTEFGLAQFDIPTKELTYLSDTPSDEAWSQDEIDLLKKPVWALSKTADELVWVGSNSANLYLMDKDFSLVKDYSALVQSTIAKYDNIEFTNLLPDGNQNVWIGTASGLFFLDNSDSTINQIRSNQGDLMFDQDWIFTVIKHWENQYWISSQYGGLSLFELNLDGSMNLLKHYDQTHSNIIDQSIYTIFQINEHEVWFTGKQNLYLLDLHSDQITNYGNSHFENTLNFHENSQFYSNDKKLYLGSNRGVIRFDPDLIDKSNSQPKVYLTGIKSNNVTLATSLEDPDLMAFKQDRTTLISPTPVHKLTHHEFGYADTIFTFQFAALDFMHSDNLNYAYRIPQLDDDWIGIQNRNELTLTNLDAGDYQLEIKATNADLQWSENTAKIEFTLLPKPWLTWWAKVFYSMVATCIAWLIFRLYHSKLLTQYALEHREVQLSQAIWGSGDELWEWDIRKHEIIRTNNAELDDDRRRYFNGSFASSTLNIHPSDVEKLQTKIQSILAGETDEFDAVYRQKNKQGKWQWMQDRAKVTAWSNDRKPLTINGISRNINTIKEKEEKSQLIASAFQSSSDGALVLDADLRIISINTAFTKITGYDERVINTTLQKNSDRISADDMDSLTLFNHIKSGIFTTGSYRNEILIQTLGGNKLPIDLRVNCIYNAQKNPSHYIVTLTDITYRKNTEEALKKLANYDNLTGLPNRSLMMIQLNQALLQADRNDKHMAIMFVDLDHFKNINDSLGHTIGDELLIAVANRLTQCVRKSDTIARIGGDEFTIGILSYEHINDVINVAKKVLEHMSEPFQLENHELIITPSIGIATTNGTQTDIETLLMQADTAMYHAKKRGRNNFRFFTESMNQAVLQRVDIEMRLRKALQNNELLLHYQPKYNLATGVVSGFEALLRWQDANQVLTPPDEFIPIAEETGLIFSIGEFVLESACQELKKWHENGFKDIHVAINLSAIQFIDKKLALVVGKILEKYKIPPLSLEIEITESTLIENLEYAIKTLHELRDLGVKLSLDDFGTGFSSLNYLKQFPIHALKIDRTFIRDMVNDSRDASMVDSIVSLAHNLSIEVIAEGVESIEQLELLASYNIEEAQGYLLSKPVDSDTVTEILNQGQTITHILAGLKGK